MNLSIKERFFIKTRITQTCWIWSGCCDKNGYGIIFENGKFRKAHRVSWEIHNGTIPNGLCILHRCDNPSCVNPKHLFSGTQGDNVDDCVNKNRHKNPIFFGERHPMAKLNWDNVREIRENRHFPIRHFSKKFGVSKGLIGLIRRNKLWVEK